jgi:hypothetical protein
MPTIKLLDSIKIQVYFRDHMPPHFHAIYNEYEVLIEINSLEVYSGSLPHKQMKKVREYAEKNQEFILKKWNEFNPKI